MSNAGPADIYNLCQFQFANKRLCGMPAHPKGDGMCLNHFRHVNAKPAPREDDLSPRAAQDHPALRRATALTPLFPLLTQICHVSPLFPLHTQNIGGDPLKFALRSPASAARRQ
jgi:hypothetical protein